MKRMYILLFLASLVFFSNTAYSMPWPPEVDAVYIKFNNTSGTTYDAVNIRKNYSTNIPVPEWNASRNEKIAYIKG